MIEYIRLAFGTVLVLLPGLALGRTMSEVVAWTMGALFLAWTVVFTAHSNIKVAALLLLVLFVAALVARRRLAIERQRPGGAIAIGIVLGWFLWHTAGAVVGDGLFHEARVRKLVHLGDLHLARSTSSRTEGCIPATRSHCGIGSTPSSRGSRASIRRS